MGSLMRGIEQRKPAAQLRIIRPRCSRALLIS
jgi:hypothetical protein